MSRLRRAALLAATLAAGAALAEPPPDRARRHLPDPAATTASAEPLHETPEARLAAGRQAYDRGDYAAAIMGLRPLLHPEVLLSSDDEIAARKLLALSYFYQREIPAAEKEFVALLQLKEDFALDPVLDPLPAIRFLEKLRKDQRDKLDELGAQRRREEEQRRREQELRHREDEERARRARRLDLVVRTVERHHLVLAFLPFGVGQFQNGDRKKAVLFLSSQTALAAASLTLFGFVYFTYPSGRPRTPGPSQDLAQNLTISQIAIGSLFWLDVAIGIVDALVHYAPEVVTESHPAAPAATPPVARTRVAPYLTSGGGGLLLQGAF